MRETASDSASFPTARCGQCERIVLTYLAYDSAMERRHCVHCDTVIGTPLEWITATELEAEGYAIGVRSKPAGQCGGCGTCSVRGH
ncbi:MAG: hypothetical protein ACREQ4_10935 [Candidatus Binataceae bacterium]